MLLVVCLSLLTSFSFAQSPGVFKYISLVNVADSTTVSPVNCRIYYNEQSNKPKIYYNNAWHDLVGGGSSFSLSNGNGTTAVGSAVNLGGTLTAATTITGAFDLNFGTSASRLGSIEFNASSAGGVFRVRANSIEMTTNGSISIGASSSSYVGYLAANGPAMQGSSNHYIRMTTNGTEFKAGATNATGDMYYRNSSSFLTRIAAGSDGSILRMGASSVPTWSTLTIPTTISANSIFVSNSANILVQLTPTGGQSIRMNAGNTAWEAFTPGGGGITNTAANTELMKSDGTNAIPSGVFIPSNGSVTMGSSSISGNRTLTMESSSTNSGLVLVTKAAGILQIVSSNAPTLGIVVDPNASTLYCANTATFNIRGTSSGTNGQDLNIEAGTGTGGTGGRLILRGGLSGVSEANYGNINISSPIVEIGVFNHVASTSTIVRGVGGNNSAVNGIDLTFQGGAAYTVSGNGNGGDVTIQSGLRRAAGSGTDGDIVIDALTGSVFLTQAPTTDNSITKALMRDTSTGALRLSDVTRSLVTSTTVSGNVNATPTSLFSYTLPASTLSTNGYSIHIKASGDYAGNSNTKFLEIVFDGNTIFSQSCTSSAQSWNIEGDIIRISNTSIASNFWYINADGTVTPLTSTLNPTTVGALSSSRILLVRATGVATDDIFGEIFKVKFEN